MPGKRNWLKKITRWIFDAPNERTSKKARSIKSEAKQQEERNQDKNVNDDRKIKSQKLLQEAWKRFINQWKAEGYETEQFIKEEFLEKTIQSLDKDFQNELIESLFKISSDKEALASLSDILNRGKVTGGDNLNAIRSFSYISALTVVKETRSKSIEKELSNVPKETVPKKIEEEQDISFLNLSVRTYNTLRRAGFKNTSELETLDKNDLLAIKNLGNKSADEVLEAIKKNKKINPKNNIISIRKQLVNKHKKESSKKEINPEINQFIQEGLDITTFKLDKEYSHEETIDDLKGLCTKYQVPKEIKSLLENTVKTISILESSINPESQNEFNIINLIRQEILNQYLLSQTNDGLKNWGKRLETITNDTGSRRFSYLFFKSQGLTYAEIGRRSSRTRESIRKCIDSVQKCIGIDPQIIEDRFEKKNVEYERETVERWIHQYGRLPTRNDQLLEEETNNELLNEVLEMSLRSRNQILFINKIEVPSGEYDYQYTSIINQTAKVGNGYWLDFVNLEEFLYRHAAQLGEPHLMPKQTSLPDSVKGIVTRFGGQKRVAERINLEYQGQLVGEEGKRKYWTEEKLITLLNDIERQMGLGKKVMPSNAQIYEFLRLQENDSSYKEKKPGSIIAALTKQGTLNWIEVAERFDRIYIAEKSNKEITLSYIRAFVKDLGEHIDSLTPAEMYVLFQSQGISQKDNEKFSRTFDLLVDAIQSGVVSKEELGNWASDNDVPHIESLIEFGSELKEESSLEEKEAKLLEERSRKSFNASDENEEIQLLSKDDLPGLDPEKTLNALDKAIEVVESTSSDADKVEFLKAKASAKLWDSCFENEQVLIQKVEKLTPPLDAYSQEVKEEFLSEYQGAKSLDIPKTYQFVDLKGRQRDPKLMQRLVAYRLLRDKRLLNLSGTGTGKTLSAIFAAQVCQAKRILISSPNGAISTWVKAFTSAFPKARLHIKPDGWSIPLLGDDVNVYLVNHERFQETYSERILQHCVNYQTDLIVIDEIHQSKRRTKDKSSQRRKLINEYIRISSNMNPDLRVLGMSATPVINNLYEGRSLLELVTQKSIEDVDEKIDLNSCMNLYQHFVREGIRMNPGAMRRTKITKKVIDATSIISEIISATKNGTYHDVEQLLVKPKLDSLSECLTKGTKTVIFISYIKNTLRPLSNWLTNRGFSYCTYTGNDKEAEEEGFKDALDQFINGSTEVLIASIKCVGTGVDGLQATCNRAIFFQLPWTSTEFEQAVGRLDRDGTEFDSIDVFLPITDINLPNGEQWSWCRSKLDRINSKRDIAKAAVDGEVPDAASMISPSEASKYWVNWLERLNKEMQETT